MRQTARLENWTLIGGCLHGNVYGHSRFPDGTFVTTSPVLTRTDNTAETLNTTYELGKGYESPALRAHEH